MEWKHKVNNKPTEKSWKGKSMEWRFKNNIT